MAHPGSVGRASPGRSLTTDERGQLWYAVPRWARFEYWRAPDKTAAGWDGDRVTVGDLGRVDRDGVVWLDGRREDLVISGGVDVYPAGLGAWARLDPAKQPKSLHPVDELPRTSTGKVRRLDLPGILGL